MRSEGERHMKEQIIMAGSGGQGVLSAGKMIAEAFMEEGKEITYFPTYGSAVRGGTSNVTITVSEKRIACPVAIPDRVTIGIIFNQESLDKYEPYLKAGALLLYNTSLIAKEPSRTDVRCCGVPANKLAEEAGSAKCVNMVMLGALIGLTGICNCETLYRLVDQVFTGTKVKLAAINRKAIKAGMTYIQSIT